MWNSRSCFPANFQTEACFKLLKVLCGNIREVFSVETFTLGPVFWSELMWVFLSFVWIKSLRSALQSLLIIQRSEWACAFAVVTLKPWKDIPDVLRQIVASFLGTCLFYFSVKYFDFKCAIEIKLSEWSTKYSVGWSQLHVSSDQFSTAITPSARAESSPAHFESDTDQNLLVCGKKEALSVQCWDFTLHLCVSAGPPPSGPIERRGESNGSEEQCCEVSELQPKPATHVRLPGPALTSHLLKY